MKRALPVVACGALIFLAILDFVRFANGQARALDLAQEHGLSERHPELASEVGRHYDPIFAELRVARALLNDELDRSWMSGMPAAQQRLEAERGLTRLRDARALAEASWPRRPSSWEAALVQGGAAYLELYRTRDSRLIAGSEMWERPLLAAHRLGPSQTGPVRFLAAAYLGNWSSLAAEQRRTAAALVAQGFRDRRTFLLLIRDWLRVAPTRRQALEPIPDQPWAWETLMRIFAAAGDHEWEVAARRRWHDSLEADQERVLADARTALIRGEKRRARHLLLTLLERLPRSLGFAPTMGELLEILPPGPTGGEHAAAFADWLDWALELCVLKECPFEERASSRLALLSGDLLPATRALAFLAAGDLPQAQLVQRRFAQTAIDAWVPYFLLKAEVLARSGRFEDAVQSLAALPASSRDQPRFWIAQREIARLAADSTGEAESALALSGLSRSTWSLTDWRRTASTARLEVLPETEASGLTIEVVDAEPGGAIFDVLWDGRLVAIRRTTGPEARFEIELPVEAGLHYLDIVFHSGGSARPGTVSIL